MKKKKDLEDIQTDRYGMFMTDNSFELDIMYGRNYLQTDNVNTVIIHRINVIESKSHVLYGQAKPKDKKYLPPVKINVMPNIEEGKQENYGGNPGGIARDDTGPISFGVYLKELEEKKITISRGDIVEYNFSGEKKRYYEVENANNVTDETKKSIGGFKPYWKRVTGVPVKEDVTPYLSETKGEAK
jgi:hypothetical protein